MPVIESRFPVDLAGTLSGLRNGGRWDPCVRVGFGDVWRATWFPSGPATMHLRSVDTHHVAVSAVGPGADAAIASAAALIGADDDDGGLLGSSSLLVRRLARSFGGLRQGRTDNLLEALVPTIIHQKVQTVAAARSFREMVRAFGVRAPGGELWMPPTASWLSSQPSFRWHQWGVEWKRARTIVLAARFGMSDVGAVPGIGPWTRARVAGVVSGDPDAVMVGDYWLCHIVCNALAGEVRGTDERMLELLAPFEGQRGRVCRLLRAGGPPLPRFGPRLDVRDIRAI